ncbi:hypothetical protein NL676_038053 [Syzygium grande]|nr:hypothetical protein NL676_038053 [Syzygium grande]
MQAVLALILPTLLNFITVKYQGGPILHLKPTPSSSSSPSSLSFSIAPYPFHLLLIYRPLLLLAVLASFASL